MKIMNHRLDLLGGMIPCQDPPRFMSPSHSLLKLTPRHTPRLPQQCGHPQPGSPDPLEEVPVAVELKICSERCQLRGQRRIRRDTHSRRMEELRVRHFIEAERQSENGGT